MLNETPDLVLVLDCRARASYTASHTDLKKCPQWLSVPEELILKGYVLRGGGLIDMWLCEATPSVIQKPYMYYPACMSLSQPLQSLLIKSCAVG